MKRQKSPVQLREKQLKDGSKSLYLDIYINGKRTYKYLKMYLSPGKDKTTQAKNKATLLAAQKIAADELVKLTNDKAGIANQDNSTTFIAYMKYYEDKKRKTGQSEERANVVYNTIKILEPEFGNLKLADVNERHLERMIEILKSRGLKPNTVKAYYSCVVSALNMAVRERKIIRNPNELVDTALKPKEERTHREYLTREELDAFEAAPITKKGVYVKKAFLFSARYCGLRRSDLANLKWSDIQDGQIRMQMQKTREMISIPLTKEAMDFLGTNDSEYVFPEYRDIDRQLTWSYVRRIAKRAGITKEISMHTARHTFAVALLSAGVDIYTVSKLLGHATVTVTEIYADIIDKQRTNAMEKLAAWFNANK